MRKILEFLASDGAFLYEEHSFRIVSSEHVPTFGGTGNIVLSDGPIELRLFLERDRLFLEVRSAKHGTWYSFDLIRELLTGERDRAIMDDENVLFFRQRMADVKALFYENNVNDTVVRCDQIKRVRADRLFPPKNS